MIVAGMKVLVQYEGYAYTGTVLGINPMPVRRTGEDSEQRIITVQCACCRLVDPVSEKNVTPLGGFVDGAVRY